MFSKVLNCKNDPFQITSLLPAANRIVPSKQIINLINEVLIYRWASRMPAVWTSLKLATASLSSRSSVFLIFFFLASWFNMYSTDTPSQNGLSWFLNSISNICSFSIFDGLSAVLSVVSPPAACATH